MTTYVLIYFNYNIIKSSAKSIGKIDDLGLFIINFTFTLRGKHFHLFFWSSVRLTAIVTLKGKR